MTPAEAAALLTICAAYDNRKPDADQAKAWAMALDGRRFEDCRDAVVAHYRTTREWIMPSDVIGAVKKVRSGRLEDVALSPPPDMDPDDTARYARWLAVARRAVADGLDPSVDEYVPTRVIGDLRSLVRQPPAIQAKPSTRIAEHQAELDKVRAELDAKRAAGVFAPQTEPEPTTTESEREA